MDALLAHLAWSLIHFLWQGALVGLVYWCARRWLRNATPQARYLLALAAMLALALLPLCTFFYLGPWHVDHTGPSTVLPPQVSVMRAENIPSLSLALTAQHAFPYLSWVVWVWLTGVAFMGIRALWGWTQATSLRPAATSDVHPWQALLSTLQQKMQMQRAIRLLESARISAPLVIGWLKPVILIPPSSVCGLDWHQAEMILAHELAHIRRHDYLFNLLQVMVETLLFYHPVVHWISRDARNEREFCCDDIAMQICGDRLNYLKALTELEQRRQPTSTALAANGGTLLQRAYRLVYRIEPVGAPPTWSVMLVLVGGFLAATPLMRPVRATTQIAAHVSVASSPTAVIQTVIPASRNLQVAAVRMPARRAVPAPTRITPPAATALLAKLSVIPLPPQTVIPLAAAPPPQPAEVSIPAASGITLVAPHPLSRPQYPYVALRDGLGGSVQVAFRINANGQTADIRTQVISGPAMLASTTRAALENWQFNPVRVNGKTLTPQVNLEFVFSAEPGSKPAGSCTLITGSHVCHWYRIGLQNVTLGESNGGSGVSTNHRQPVNLAVMGNSLAAVCRPQDQCFFAASQPGRDHEQRIHEQFRLLSQGFLAGGSF